MTNSPRLFISDHETAVDLLYYESIAQTVVHFIRQSPANPITIGVHGDWGAGKSSILKMVDGAFARDPRTLCLWFNGWTFEGFEDAKTILIETLVSELRDARPTSTKVAEKAKHLLKRVDWLKLAHKAGGFALTAATGIPTPEVVSTLWNAAKAVLEKPQDHIDTGDVKSIFDHAGEFLKAGTDAKESVPEHVHAFRREFTELLEAADIDQLIVLIDDLDRCLPETAIATLEAMRLFLFVPRTAFVIAADEAMIEYSVRRHFPELPSSGPVSYARNYLEKLIQVPFRVPTLGLAETRVYITLLLSQMSLPEDDPNFVKLLAAGRAELRRPWQSSGLDRSAVHKALGAEIPDAVDEALRISEQITRLLTDGTRGNPRQIKRFLNSMALRKAIASERGFGDDIQTNVLAKIMLAERFLPELYEQMARNAASDPNGRDSFVAELETEALERTQTDAKKRKRGEGSSDVRLQNDSALDWAAIAPPLAQIDLRPYVFVSRDKRSYFGGVLATDHLEVLTERLMGSTIAVRSAEPEIGRLTASETEQVFDALRERIMANELTNMPSGVAGLVVLVRKHPGLQRRLLSLVRDIPSDKAGAWAATGWAECFVDPMIQKEFVEVRAGWAEHAGSSALKAAAKAASKMPRRG